jgi:hypothetical protein
MAIFASRDRIACAAGGAVFVVAVERAGGLRSPSGRAMSADPRCGAFAAAAEPREPGSGRRLVFDWVILPGECWFGVATGDGLVRLQAAI